MYLFIRNVCTYSSEMYVLIQISSKIMNNPEYISTVKHEIEQLMTKLHQELVYSENLIILVPILTAI